MSVKVECCDNLCLLSNVWFILLDHIISVHEIKTNPYIKYKVKQAFITVFWVMFTKTANPIMPFRLVKVCLVDAQDHHQHYTSAAK